MAENLAGVGRELDVSLPTIYGEFRMLREATGIMRSCATAFPLGPHTGTTANIINYGRFTSYQLQEGVDMAQAQAIADFLTQVTPSERGVHVILPETTLRRIADPGLESKVAQMMNDAYDAKEDGDGCDQLINFTTRLGGAGNAMSLGYIQAATGRLDLGNVRRQDSAGTRPQPAPKPWYGALHPMHGGIVQGKLIPLASEPSGTAGFGAGTGANAGDDIVPSANSMQNDLLKAAPGSIGTLFGAEIKIDPYINVDASDDASSAVFSKEGLIFCEEVAPQLKSEDSITGRKKQLVMVGSYEWTLYLPDNDGIEILADATLPTS